MKIAQYSFPVQTTYSWTKLDSNTTKMTLRNNGYPSGFSKLLAPLMSSEMRSPYQTDLLKLKLILGREYPLLEGLLIHKQSDAGIIKFSTGLKHYAEKN